MKLISAFLVSILFSPNLTMDDHWDLRKQTETVAIYTREFQGSDIKEFKAVSIFEGVTFEQFVYELFTATTYKDQCNFNTSYFLESYSTNTEKYFYYKEKLPWPVKNRDIVTQLKIKEKTDNKILLSIETAPEILDEMPQTIRVKELQGYWLLEKVPEGIKATQQIHLDPGGNVPSFIVNSLIVKGPLKTFKELRKALQPRA